MALMKQLNNEWAGLVNDYPAFRTWAMQDVLFGSCVNGDDVLAIISGHSDHALRVLIGWSQAGNQLATRVVLQSQLGLIVRLALGRDDDWLDDLITHTLFGISTYPLDRRPNKISANLVLDARKQLLASRREKHPDLMASQDPTTTFDQVAVPAGGGAPTTTDRDDPTTTFDQIAAHQVLDTAAELGIITASSHRILLAVYQDGESGQATAERMSMTPAAVRSRCRDTTRRLRKHRQALLDELSAA